MKRLVSGVESARTYALRKLFPLKVSFPDLTLSSFVLSATDRVEARDHFQKANPNKIVC